MCFGKSKSFVIASQPPTVQREAGAQAISPWRGDEDSRERFGYYADDCGSDVWVGAGIFEMECGASDRMRGR